MCQIVKSRDVFADDVKLDVHHGAFFDGMEVGVVVGVGNDADLEGVFRWATNREAHAVDGHASLIHSEVSVLDHLFRTLVAEGVLMASLLVLDCDTNGGLVNVALYDVPVKTPIHHHRALNIHFVANLQEPKIASFQRLSHGCHGISVPLETHHGEANAVVSNALVDAQLADEGTCKRQMHVVLLVFDGNHSCHTFYDSRKHKRTSNCISPTKVQISEHNTKGKRKFFLLLSSGSTFEVYLKGTK